MRPTLAGPRRRAGRVLRNPAGGPNGGHWAAFIQAGDEVVFASPHERRYVEAAIEMALVLAADLEAAG